MYNVQRDVIRLMCYAIYYILIQLNKTEVGIAPYLGVSNSIILNDKNAKYYYV